MNEMTKDQFVGLILVAVGVYAAIRYRYNGQTALKDRKKIAKFLSFGKVSEESSKSEITYAQLMYLIIGILFIIIGLSKIFNF